ncbi:MAG TPA: outer membrane beta-barrel protein [Tahibacter sp.]|uniref:outer membrane beta-barrel protein n=1 Tax=Tahibacter sp. TaxID=2056211 RepID=UPI002C2C7E0C|nr:outer membrane beta-barrel protein [Tahibacter sp.]HSX59791.1 outer membrane beta-barrel protein [Tahibacter sp.]
MFKKLLCATLICAGAGAAHAGDTGFFVGGGIGQARYDDNLTDQIRTAYAGDPGYAFVSGRMTDDTDQAWKLFGGYRFLPWLGVEFGWVDLGEVGSNYVLHSQVPATNADAVIDGLYNIAGPSATVFGELDFNDRTSGLLRVGLYNAQLDYDETGTGADGLDHRFSNSADHTKLTYGLGLNVRVTPNWDVRLDWDRYTNVGRRFDLTNDGNGRFDHIDFVSMNLAYRFGQ